MDHGTITTRTVKTYTVVGMQAHAIALFQTMLFETLGNLTDDLANLGCGEGSLRIFCFDEYLGGTDGEL